VWVNVWEAGGSKARSPATFNYRYSADVNAARPPVSGWRLVARFSHEYQDGEGL
jgi:hypothetical protein